MPTRTDNPWICGTLAHIDFQPLTFHLDEPLVLTGYYNFAPGAGWCLHADLEESKELRNVLCLRETNPP